ncbi:peptide chain release factor 2 [Kiloniella antarctica]|uniref:Peptide chain release factor 2 n=1 Tax=Kiloniella antarctica TaxID=1550907 RepID=A0ABW5BL69_9PROT
MRAEIEAAINDIEQSLVLLRRHLDWDAALRRLDELNVRAEDPELWNDQQLAQALMKERTHLEQSIAVVRKMESGIEEAALLIEMGDEEGDSDSVQEGESQIFALKELADKKQLESLLSGEADANDCYLQVNAGAGGTEAQDWAEMLLRMYTRWAEQHGYKVEWLEENSGDEAGLKSATVTIKGHNAYGWLKTEAGVHRLVRISPYDSQARRHTSFSSAWVYPVIDDSFDVEILDKDLRVDTFRASGAGGQHVNTTDSAIRIVHEPTGIVVQCQNDRSQHKNRATAMNMLKSRLFEHEMQKREEVSQAEADSKTEIGWGRQIRSYVLQPYQMVKDLRTGVETSNSSAVLNGDIDMFLEASLASKLKGGTSEDDGAEEIL